MSKIKYQQKLVLLYFLLILNFYGDNNCNWYWYSKKEEANLMSRLNQIALCIIYLYFLTRSTFFLTQTNKLYYFYPKNSDNLGKSTCLQLIKENSRQSISFVSLLFFVLKVHSISSKFIENLHYHAKYTINSTKDKYNIDLPWMIKLCLSS